MQYHNESMLKFLFSYDSVYVSEVVVYLKTVCCFIKKTKSWMTYRKQSLQDSSEGKSDG